MTHHGFDLHIHSSASDGQLSPAQVVQRAKERGIRNIALTDHDTVEGLLEANLAAGDHELNLINGIELSCEWQGMTLHVLGLAIDPRSPAMQEATSVQKENRTQRARVIADRLSKLNFGSVWDTLSSQLEGKVPARPDFARYLVEQGHVDSVQQAFDRYLGAGKIGDVKQFWPPLAEVVAWIRKAGGIAVLAHPMRYKMTTAKLRRLLEEFVSVGGKGLEVSVPNLDSGRIGLLAELCDRYRLLGSCGSDFHAVGRPWQDLGCFPPLPERVTPVWEWWLSKADPGCSNG